MDFVDVRQHSYKASEEVRATVESELENTDCAPDEDRWTLYKENSAQHVLKDAYFISDSTVSLSLSHLNQYIVFRFLDF